MLRSARLFTGAAIDTYFHERTRRALAVRPLSKTAEQYAVTLGGVDDLIEAFLSNRAKSPARGAVEHGSRRSPKGDVSRFHEHRASV